MEAQGIDMPELQGLGSRLRRFRVERGMSQGQVAEACAVSQAQISLFETGRRLPSLEQFLRIARALDVPFGELLSGAHPKSDLKDLAVELRRLGAVDLWVADSVVPAAARDPGEVIARAVSGPHPEPRVVEAIPALLGWNHIDPLMLQAYGMRTKTIYRLAWLADIALTIDRRTSFPGGFRRSPLILFLKGLPLPPRESPDDDLGMPAKRPPTSPIWRRWKISAGMTLNDFAERVRSLAVLRERAGMGNIGINIADLIYEELSSDGR